MIAARVIGHRGAAGLAPENTLAAIRAAAEVGTLWVEIDVRLLGDGTPVVHHDATVDRCSDGSGALSSYDGVSIRRLDAGAWYGEAFAGERIPLLTDALLLIRDLGLGVNLELKAESDAPAGRLVEAVHRALDAVGMPMERVLVSSFEPSVLEATRARVPQLHVGCLWSQLPWDWRQRTTALGAVSVHCDWRYLTERAASAVKSGGLELYCYTVNAPRAFSSRWKWGVDGVFTDRPDGFLPGDHRGRLR